MIEVKFPWPFHWSSGWGKWLERILSLLAEVTWGRQVVSELSSNDCPKGPWSLTPDLRPSPALFLLGTGEKMGALSLKERLQSPPGQTLLQIAGLPGEVSPVAYLSFQGLACSREEADRVSHLKSPQMDTGCVPWAFNLIPGLLLGPFVHDWIIGCGYMCSFGKASLWQNVTYT